MARSMRAWSVGNSTLRLAPRPAAPAWRNSAQRRVKPAASRHGPRVRSLLRCSLASPPSPLERGMQRRCPFASLRPTRLAPRLRFLTARPAQAKRRAAPAGPWSNSPEILNDSGSDSALSELDGRSSCVSNEGRMATTGSPLRLRSTSGKPLAPGFISTLGSRSSGIERKSCGSADGQNSPFERAPALTRRRA